MLTQPKKNGSSILFFGFFIALWNWAAIATAAKASAGALSATSPSCLVALDRVPPAVEVQMVAATGKGLPFDAGKVAVCENIEVASGFATKFFIATITLMNGTMRGELGICLPASCVDADLEIIRKLAAIGALGNSTAGRVAQRLAVATAFPARYTGDWPAPPGTVTYPNPFNTVDDRVPWGTRATAATVVSLALVYLVGVSTLLVRRRRRRGLTSRSSNGTNSSAPGVTPQRLLSSAGTGAVGASQVLARPQRSPLGVALLEAFSLAGPEGTWAALWKVPPQRPTDCLNGMKVISMFCIVMGHGLLEPLNVAGYRNAECIIKSPICLNAASTNAWSYMLLVGQLCVDTFFFISGFLLSYVGRSRKLPILLGTALRYARLLPLFAFVMMLYVFVSPYLTYGPFAPRFQSSVFDNCSDNTWWSELLFINALYPWYTNDGGCMGWSWYLGVDMLFAICGLVLLRIRARSPLIALIITVLAGALSVAVTIQQSLHHNLQYNVISPSFAIYGHYLYSRPYARLPGFLLGLAAPWSLEALERAGLRRDDGGPRRCGRDMAVFGLCLLALGVAVACVFLPALNSAGPGPPATARPALQWTLWQNALWIGLSRPVWVACWLVWTLACYFGHLPNVSAFLGAKVFTPLSALTYSAYLVHPVVIKVLAGNAEDYYTYSFLDTLQRTLWYFVLAYGASVLLWVLVERPAAALTGWLVPRRAPTQAAPKVTFPSSRDACSPATAAGADGSSAASPGVAGALNA